MGLEEIMSIIRKGPEIVSQMDSVKLNTKSIARGAKDSTFQFPCLITDSAPIDMANTVARTLDQVYASFTQTWLSMNSMFDITIDPTPLSYLRRLHQNLKLENAIDNLEVKPEDVSSYMEKVYDGSYRLYMNSNKTCGILVNAADKGTKAMLESNHDLLREYMSDYDLVPFEALEADGAYGAMRQANDKFNNATKTIFGDNEEPPQQSLNDEYNFVNAAINSQINKNRRDNLDNRMRQTDRAKTPLLLDRDVKKSNDLMPYGIQIRLIALNDKKEFVQYVDFIIGVKTILHIVKSDDMIENIARSLKNKSLTFKLLKWTTGEISLVKDIILNLNDIKDDAINRSNGKSPFFSTLKRLKARKLGVRNLTVPHALIPNATMVITVYEADVLEDKYGIDIRNERMAKALIKNLFLMAFIIMDEGTNTLSVLYDGDDSYQIYSMDTLERDNALNSNKLGREIGRMISH